MSMLIVLLLGFLFSALFSGAETGIYSINRIRLRMGERKRDPAALRLTRLLRNPHRLIFTVLIGNNIAVYFLSKATTDLFLASGMQTDRLLLGFFPWNAEMAATLTLTLPLFIFGEVAPKNFFRTQADRFMYRLARPLRLLDILFLPFTWPLQRIFQLLVRGHDESLGFELHRLSPEGLKDYFSAGAKEGIISSEQSRMVDRVSNLHQLSVRTLMTPLRQMPTLPPSASVADFRKLCAQRKTSEALLIEKHTVLGLVSIFSLIPRKLADDAPIRPYARDVLRLRDTRTLKSAFYRLRRSPRHLAIIVDARDHPIGLLRLEDIARYISGSSTKNQP